MKKIAAITMARNDDFYLRKWVAYYGSQLGRENLYIYLDGLDQTVGDYCDGTHAQAVEKIGNQVVAAEKGRLSFLSEKAARLIEEAGYTVRVDDVLAIDVPDRPGGLSEVLAQLSNFGIEINYLYSFAQQGKSNALIVFRVEDSGKTAKILSDHGVKCVSHEEVSAL